MARRRTRGRPRCTECGEIEYVLPHNCIEALKTRIDELESHVNSLQEQLWQAESRECHHEDT